jgi:hypothetical protein
VGGRSRKKGASHRALERSCLAGRLGSVSGGRLDQYVSHGCQCVFADRRVVNREDVHPPVKALVHHWNGRAWSSRTTGGYLFGIASLSPRDVWAVGIRNAP